MAGDRDGSRLPGLIDQKGIREELGVTAPTAEAIIARLAVVRIPGHRRLFVYRDDVRALLRAGERAPEGAG